MTTMAPAAALRAGPDAPVKMALSQVRGPASGKVIGECYLHPGGGSAASFYDRSDSQNYIVTRARTGEYRVVAEAGDARQVGEWVTLICPQTGFPLGRLRVHHGEASAIRCFSRWTKSYYSILYGLPQARVG